MKTGARQFVWFFFGWVADPSFAIQPGQRRMAFTVSDHNRKGE